jgi:hypothetical protein
LRVYFHWSCLTSEQLAVFQGVGTMKPSTEES